MSDDATRSHAAMESSTTAAKPIGTCWRCGGVLYHLLAHSCTTNAATPPTHATPKRVTNAEIRREAERLAPFSPRARPHATPDRVEESCPNCGMQTDDVVCDNCLTDVPQPPPDRADKVICPVCKRPEAEHKPPFSAAACPPFKAPTKEER